MPMALRKEPQKRKFNEAIAPILEPGEGIEAGCAVLTGPSPWLGAGVGLLILYGLGTRPYYVAVTDRRVIFMRPGLWSARQIRLGHADPRSAVSISDVRRGRIWNRFQYRRPDGTTVRVNIHRIWAPEMEGIVRALA